MQHFAFEVTCNDDLESALKSPQTADAIDSARSVFVQIVSSSSDLELYSQHSRAIAQIIPEAIIVGVSSYGEICNGSTLTDHTIISVSTFDTTILNLYESHGEPGTEFESGRALAHEIKGSISDLKGIQLLLSPITSNAIEFLAGFDCFDQDVTVFGGGAGDHEGTSRSVVFDGTECRECVALAIAFSGSHLRVSTWTQLGWKPLSQEMTVTSVQGMSLETIDNVPAYEIYSKYLGLTRDIDFFQNAIEFPLLLEREGERIARVPVNADEAGHLQMIGEVRIGDKVRLGYGNPSVIVGGNEQVQGHIEQFEPEAIYLFSCVCRRFLLDKEADLETQRYQSIAPTFGFYTSGEVFQQNNKIGLLNATMVAVAMSETALQAPDSRDSRSSAPLSEENKPSTDTQSRRLIARMAHFVGAVSSELEHSNRELAKANQELEVLSTTDKLTGLYNRAKLDTTLDEQVSAAARYHKPFSILMVDIDYFKNINDNHGHLVGDAVLVEFARLLRLSLRKSDVVGRWGGEEFLLVLPNSDALEAYRAAESLRNRISEHPFEKAGNITISIGVSTFVAGDDVDNLLGRADNALYTAKENGRNATVVFDQKS